MWRLTVLLAMVFSAMAAAAHAAEGPSITFEVRDTVTGRALPVSGVILRGPLSTTLLTDRDGNATFTDVPPGRYTAVVGAPRYQRVTVPAFTVGTSETRIRVELAAQDLRVIGSTTTRRTARRPHPESEASGSLRTLSLDALGAIGRLPGVDVQDGFGSNGEPLSAVSLEGHPADQTGVSIDGMPIISSRLAGDLIQYTPDLFATSRVSFDPRPGALAGSLDFLTIAPSLYFRGRLDGTSGGHDYGFTGFSASDSSGRLGVAAIHTTQGNEGPFSGQRFLDASGLDYTHGGDNLRRSDLIKVQQIAGDRGTLSLVALDATRTTDLVCGERANAVPCGFGPGNRFEGRFHYLQADAYLLVGAVTLRADALQSRTRTTSDLSQRVINALARPFSSEGVHDASGLTGIASLPLGRHTVSATGAAVHERDEVRDLIETLPLSGASRTRSSLLSLSDVYQAGTTRLTTAFGRSSFGGTIGANASLSAQHALSAHDALGIGVSTDRQQSPEAAVPFVADGTTLRFYCDASVAAGIGPQVLGGAARADSLRLTYGRQWRQEDDLNVVLYDQHQRNATLSLPLAADAFSPALPPSFFNDAAATAAGPLVCGSPRSFSSSNVVLQTLLSGADVEYRGYRAHGTIAAGALTAQWQFAVQDAALRALPAIASRSSLVKAGDQLPQVPHLTYGVTLDYKRPHSFTELLAAVRGYGANNRYSQRPVMSVDLAAKAESRRGTFTLRLTDFNIDPGHNFRTIDGGILRSASGTALPLLALPRTPRAVSVTYALAIGDTFRREAGRGRDLVDTRATGDDKVTLSLPDARPADAFRIRNGSAACTFERARTIGAFLTQIERFTTAVQPSQGTYPEEPPVPLPTASGFTLHYHSLGSTYAIAIAVTSMSALQGWVGCARLHAASEDDVVEQHLFGSPVGFDGIPFYYMREVGLYSISAKTPLTPFRRYSIDVANPRPFDLVSYPSCGRYFRPTAAALLPVLQRDLAMPAFQSHQTERYSALRLSDDVVALYFRDGQDLGSLLNCVHLSGVDPVQAARYSLSGRPSPALNYSRRYGFFVLARGDAPKPADR